MKISKLFHWLYASLMLLPFASVVSTTLYYSFNKNAVVPQVQKEVSKEVDFNQVFDYSNTDLSGVTLSNFTYTITSTASSGGLYSFTNYDTTETHKYLLKCDYNFIYSGTGNYTFNYNINGQQVNIFSTSNTNKSGSYAYILDKNSNIQNSSLGVIIYRDNGVVLTNSSYWSLQVFDLTKMFGAGDEPSVTEFNTWFPDDYYPYTLSEHIVIPNYDTIQVADESINHFWLPSFGAIGYNIQSYIGWLIGSVFGLNVVNGIGFVIVRLFTYWLIISICWLIFDLLMYVPNLVHKWLDKAAID